MKSERFFGGGYEGTSEKYFFEGVTFYFEPNSNSGIELVAKRGQKTVLRIYINRTTSKFNVFLSSESKLEVEHLYAIERLFQSYALTFGFSVIQLLLPIFGALRLKNNLEFEGDLEIFPPRSS